MATYLASSPYFTTPLFGNALDVMTPRPITKAADDTVYTIDNVYNLRPDILAFDLYGNAALWWVFAARNPNVLPNPLFDFTAGKIIYLPSKINLKKDLGV